MFKLTIVILAICAFVTQAAVIRTSDKDLDMDMLETTTTVTIDNMSTTKEPEQTTIKDSDPTTTTTERNGALSRDEEATILIFDQTLLDPSPAELIKTEAEAVDIEKSAKLLLLSTPKIAEKPKQPEENLEESEEEENDMVENITETNDETTTMYAQNDETTTSNFNDEHNQMDIKDEIKSQDMTTTESSTKSVERQSTEVSMVDQQTTEKITKLYPINDTLYSDNIKTKENSATLVVDDQPKETLNSNLNTVVFEESEADYVLVESEVLEGSYTDIDSELHLQPIVQSVEIVPSSLDNNLLINYVQSW